MSIESLPFGNEYKLIASYVNLSNIVFIDKIIVHPYMETAFEARRQQIIQKRGFCNVLSLFHGTSDSAIQHIINEGFDLNMCKSCAYGKGIYFAKNASFSISYCSKTGPIKYIFLCDVLIGTTKVGYNNEPFTEAVDNFTNNDNTIYISNYMDGILPRYVIAVLK